jgi:hypothetical protein
LLSLENEVKRMQRMAAIAIGVALASVPAATYAFDAKAAHQTCLERYNIEKEGGTIPGGMAKAKYLSQCTNSMRRSAEIERELAQDQASQGGMNELTAATQPKRDTTPPTTSKPATVTTPALAAPKGH